MRRLYEGLHRHAFRYTGVQQAVYCKIKSTILHSGYTFVELLVTIIVLAILTAIAIPVGSNHIEKARIARTISEVRGLEKDIAAYKLKNGTLPETLNEVELGTIEDPWGNSYEYLKIEGAGKLKGKPRKDRFLVPVNSDYDLYSKGKDGESRAPFNSKMGRDDIVRANDGGYVGLASEF